MAMKHRRVFLARDIGQARSAVKAARRCGVADAGISFVARSDVEIHDISNRRKVADSDFVPALLRGVLYGGGLGLVGALVVIVLVDGLRWWGVALGVCIGALVGAWAGSLMGASFVDPIHRRFASEIEEGNVLVVIDAEAPVLREVDTAMLLMHAQKLDYDMPSAMS